MTLEKIRQKARELHTKTRRELFGNIAVTLIVVAISGFGIVRVHELAPRLVLAFAIAWALAGQYLFNRGMWSGLLPADAALSTGVEFYRREIERRRNLFGRFLRWSVFGPVILSGGTLILAWIGFAKNEREFRLVIIQFMPLCILFVMWIVTMFVLRSGDRRKLQQEIDELNEIDRASSR